jgi:type II secretory pathway pseudopilin PulG
MENKTMKRYKGFALLTTIVLVVLFSIFTFSILETKAIQSNLNKLKYLHLQANIHLKKIEESIDNNQTQNLTLNDNRYNINIKQIDENTTTIYYISISHIDEPVRLYKKIIKGK